MRAINIYHQYRETVPFFCVFFWGGGGGVGEGEVEGNKVDFNFFLVSYGHLHNLFINALHNIIYVLHLSYVITFVAILSTDAPSIESVSSSVSKSWIGQTVRLTCVSDGVPTPTLSWYNPKGAKFNTLQAKENTVDVTMNCDHDFGLYNCTADNGFVPATGTLRLHQIS